MGDDDVLNTCLYSGQQAHSPSQTQTDTLSLSLLLHSIPLSSPPPPGWLMKEGRVRRKRFFVLTDSNQLRYYKSEDTRQPVAGVIHLNW